MKLLHMLVPFTSFYVVTVYARAGFWRPSAAVCKQRDAVVISILSIICIINVAFPKTNGKHAETHTDQTSERQMFS